MMPLSVFLGMSVYTLLLSYGMFQLGYNSGFARGYYYVTLVQRAQKKLSGTSNENKDV